MPGMFLSISETTNERAMLTEPAAFWWNVPTRRHDNDRKNPRTPKNIYDLNRQMARRMEDIFLSRGIPVVPTIGERSGLHLCDPVGFD